MSEISKFDKEWEKKLSKEQYNTLRKKSTELPFTGKLLNNKERGVYVCAGCGTELFSSETKYDSMSGWPSFSEANKKY
jgi:peptide-methionine (R)-S-oxide reductase